MDLFGRAKKVTDAKKRVGSIIRGEKEGRPGVEFEEAALIKECIRDPKLVDDLLESFRGDQKAHQAIDNRLKFINSRLLDLAERRRLFLGLDDSEEEEKSALIAEARRLLQIIQSDGDFNGKKTTERGGRRF